MKILKFGGSSVKTPEQIEQVVQLISSAHPCAVVVSAFGGVTDQLIQLIACAERGADCNNDLQLLFDRHRQTIHDLHLKKELLFNTVQEIENELCRTLGGSKVIWLPGDIDETETDGHIDGIAAFIEPGRILVEVNSDKSDPHYKVGIDNTNALKNKTDAKGRKLQIEFIEEGIYHKDIWNGGCSSYINSYLANNAVIVPAYGYDRDHLALETYKGLYPNREIIQVPIHNIATGGGGIHCITQQQPKYE